MRRNSPMLVALLAASALGAWNGNLPSVGGFSSQGPRTHDPERPKTDADLERIAAAEAKRERRRNRK